MKINVELDVPIGDFCTDGQVYDFNYKVCPHLCYKDDNTFCGVFASDLFSKIDRGTEEIIALKCNDCLTACKLRLEVKSIDK